MEENQSVPPPLAAFPNEHPDPVQQKNPIYRSKTMIVLLIILILIVLGFGGTLLTLQIREKTTQTPIPSPMKFAAPTPVSKLNLGNSYANTKYSYIIENLSTEPTKQTENTYNYAEFLDGCFKIYAMPKGIENTIPEEKNDIPWNQLSDLKSLAVGNSKNCSTLSFSFGENGAAKVNKNEYTRLPNQTIHNTPWYAYAVATGADKGLTAHNVYFTENMTNFYLIETKEGGACPAKIPTEMFSNFLLMK